MQVGMVSGFNTLTVPALPARLSPVFKAKKLFARSSAASNLPVPFCLQTDMREKAFSFQCCYAKAASLCSCPVISFHDIAIVSLSMCKG